MTRYLVSRGGARLESRLWPSIRLFGGLLGAPVLAAVGVAIGAALDLPVLAALSMLAGVVAFVGATVLQWVYIFGAASRLKRAEAHVRAGELGPGVDLAHWTLSRVFRSDFRTRALYVLALAAERAGDFEDAAYLFAAALRAMPLFAGSSHATRLTVLASSHEAFALAALGRDAEAVAALGRAHGALPRVGQQGALEVLDNPAMGPLSINGTLSEIEERRDPRAVATLAGALLAFRRGDAQRALDAFTSEARMLAYNTLPHEQAFLARLEASAIARLGGNQYRAGALAAPPADEATERWVRAALGT